MNLSERKQTRKNQKYSGKRELKISEESQKNQSNYLIRKFTYFSGMKSNARGGIEGSVLDFGAGLGTLATEWKKINNANVDCLEIDPDQIKKISSLGFNCFTSIDKVNKKYNLIYTSNVLEHIEDDLATLKDLKTLIRNNGRLIIFVPAFMVLFSGLDKEVGHYRRYSKRELVEKTEKAGFVVKHFQYVDFLGFFASLTIRLLGYNGKAKLGSNFSFLFYDRIIFPLSVLMDFLGGRKLFGKNILLIAEILNDKN